MVFASWVPLSFQFWYAMNLLAISLPQIDDDVQRHNELLQAIRRAPTEVSDIVARRRKDFTKEFFVHLHTIAESYYDDPTEQNGETKLFMSLNLNMLMVPHG